MTKNKSVQESFRDHVFYMDNSLKHEYMNQKPTETAKAESSIMKAVDEYEKLIDKPVYDMTYSELKEMLAMQFKNTSSKSVTKNISILKNYIDFCINKNIVVHGENRLATFTAKEADDFVNRLAFKSKYITKKQLREYQNMLYNEQDKLLLELPFVGVRGRTTEDGTFEEIINLKITDVDEENKEIVLTKNNGEKRILKVETHTIELIKDAYSQKTYISNNGVMTDHRKPREITINKFKDHVLTVPSKNKFQKFTPILLSSRIRRIQYYIGNKFLTLTSLYQSGMLDKIMTIYKEKGVVTKEDILKVCLIYDYPDKYLYNLKYLFSQYLEINEKRPL